MKYPKSSEFIIIGSGIIGSSTAYHLAKAGREVIVLEARELVSQASGRNGGMVVQLDARDVNINVLKYKYNFAKKAISELKNFKKELNIDFEFIQHGSLDFIFEKKELEQLKKFVELQHSIGDEEIKIIDREETIEKMPIITEKVIGARFRPSDGRLNPLYLCFGIIDKARVYGAQFYEFSKVNEIIASTESIKGVRLKNGTVIKSKWVINCTNAWAEYLTKEIKIVPIREIAMITEIAPKLKAITFEAYIGSLFGSKNEAHAWGTTQHENGNICIGGPGLVSNHYYNSVTYDEVINTVNGIKLLFPKLEEIRIIRTWTGAFAFTPDYNPYVGHIPNIKGLFVITGLNNGFGLGPALSKLGTELILEGEASLDISCLNPMRFAGKEIILPREYTYAGVQQYIAEHSKQWLSN